MTMKNNSQEIKLIKQLKCQWNATVNINKYYKMIIL